nr:putative outer membrane porin HofQ [Candidatus Pantoea persica]
MTPARRLRIRRTRAGELGGYIASPRIFTSHQQKATIKQGSEIPYEVSAGNSGATTIEFKEAVLGMEVTPEVVGNGRIQLKIRLSQNVPGLAIQNGDSSVLSIDKQEIETQVTLKDGKTLALGGIFSSSAAWGRAACRCWERFLCWARCSVIRRRKIKSTSW